MADFGAGVGQVHNKSRIFYAGPEGSTQKNYKDIIKALKSLPLENQGNLRIKINNK